jgi:hypothetical protein
MQNAPGCVKLSEGPEKSGLNGYERGVLTVRRFLLWALVLAGGMAVPLYAGAQTTDTEGPGCDPGFRKAMSAAAWMTGQREVEVAEKLLLKPDSVMQYTCFSSLSSSYDHGTVQGPLSNYISSNFAKGSLGGGALCVGMATIWKTVKCTNFDINDFMSYAEMAAADPRTTYSPCNVGARNTAWTNALTTAYPAPATPAANGGMDAVATRNKDLFAGNCAASKPQPTGRKIPDGAGGTKDDMVCMAPGCYYNGSGGCTASKP